MRGILESAKLRDSPSAIGGKGNGVEKGRGVLRLSLARRSHCVIRQGLSERYIFRQEVRTHVLEVRVLSAVVHTRVGLVCKPHRCWLKPSQVSPL